MKQLIRRELFLLQIIIIIRDRSMTSDFIPITFQFNRYVHRKRRRRKKSPNESLHYCLFLLIEEKMLWSNWHVENNRLLHKTLRHRVGSTIDLFRWTTKRRMLITRSDQSTLAIISNERESIFGIFLLVFLALRRGLLIVKANWTIEDLDEHTRSLHFCQYVVSFHRSEKKNSFFFLLPPLSSYLFEEVLKWWMRECLMLLLLSSCLLSNHTFFLFFFSKCNSHFLVWVCFFLLHRKKETIDLVGKLTHHVEFFNA